MAVRRLAWSSWQGRQVDRLGRWAVMRRAAWPRARSKRERREEEKGWLELLMKDSTISFEMRLSVE